MASDRNLTGICNREALVDEEIIVFKVNTCSYRRHTVPIFYTSMYTISIQRRNYDPLLRLLSIPHTAIPRQHRTARLDEPRIMNSCNMNL